ncbi:FAD binding domain protein [Annulohypoxylon maeteangense]|uniref:FAD binding domain protein n=1 Tax=Annulohypoxylon maeteangense TaxID=1927788 RepID=UPI0020086AC1|nr:FAD binding domain protein [Annulohypoxylon maeteangense]KAI0889179.1 FAD binding domain protein [Annulohypoxylon maeteangense]
MPKSVVIVGGSLAGLIHGLQHKRRGNNVTILEQESGERHSHHAGIGFGANAQEFLRKYDLTGMTAAFASHSRRWAYYARPNVMNTKGSIQLTSWGLLNSILRANYDGLASTACPKPPPAAEGDGSAVYLSGKCVTALQCTKETVTVNYTDTNTNQQESIEADLVIGADGVHSTVRQLVNAPSFKQYAGYVAWRGTIPEKLVSKETVEYLSDHVSLQFSKRTYLLCYIIPTETGNFEPGERLLNWVWYYNVAENSPEMKEIFTDTSNQEHHNTVPRGLVRQEVWERCRAELLPRISAPFQELLQKTSSPFVTKIRDVICTSASFYDGKVVLVGDAFTTLRPHLGAATEQASLHSNTLESVYRGEKTPEAWSLEVRRFAQRIVLINKIIAELGTGTMFSLAKSVFFYAIFLIKSKL